MQWSFGMLHGQYSRLEEEKKPFPSGNRTQVVQSVSLVTILIASPLVTTNTEEL